MFQGYSKMAFDSYNSNVSSYDGKRKTYDDAIQADKDLKADALKAAFDPPIQIPTRPCPPS